MFRAEQTVSHRRARVGQDFQTARNADQTSCRITGDQSQSSSATIANRANSTNDDIERENVAPDS